MQRQVKTKKSKPKRGKPKQVLCQIPRLTDMTKLNQQTVRLPIQSSYILSNINGFGEFTFNLSKLLSSDFTARFSGQYATMYSRYRIDGGKLHVRVWNRSVKPSLAFHIIDGSPDPIMTNIQSAVDLQPGIKQHTILTSDQNPRSILTFDAPWTSSEIQKKEGQNVVSQFLNWSTDNPGFNVYWHYASAAFDRTPGTFIQSIVITGFIQVTVKDIVENGDNVTIHRINDGQLIM